MKKLRRAGKNHKMFNITDTGNKLEIYRRGALFARYNYIGYPKPFLGPVMTEEGIPYTRADENNPEHPHQRSIFTGHGEVGLDGYPALDFWNEPDNSGIAKHMGFEAIERERFTAKNLWCSREGLPYLDEYREFVFTDECGSAEILHTIKFTASYGRITLGPTKEAGPLGIRVADELRGDRGGKIENAEGLSGERECWGKTSAWCKYSGILSGKTLSIKVIDDKLNDRWPTAWHVRDYGLLSANNFYFKGGSTIEAGQSMKWRYKIIFI